MQLRYHVASISSQAKCYLCHQSTKSIGIRVWPYMRVPIHLKLGHDAASISCSFDIISGQVLSMPSPLFMCFTWFHEHVRHDSFICVTWLIYMCDVTHSYVWLDSFVCVTWLIRMCDMTHSHVWHGSFICVIWLIRIFGMTHLYVWHGSFICVTWLIHMCKDMRASAIYEIFMCNMHFHLCRMTHLFVWNDSLTCVTWLNNMYACVTWLTDIKDMTHWHVCICDMTHWYKCICMRMWHGTLI